MKDRKKILFKDQKDLWMRECLSTFTHYLNHVNDNKVLADVINQREAIQNSEGHDIKVTPENVLSVLNAIDAGTKEYIIKDEGRLGVWLLNVGCNEKYLISMKPSDRLKFDAVIFAALGTVTINVAVFYSQILNDRPNMDPDVRDKIRSDWDAFNTRLEAIIVADCKHKVIELFNDCGQYRDYLAEDIVTQLNGLSLDVKLMFPSYYIDEDKRELNIAAVRLAVQAANDHHVSKDEKKHLNHLLKSITKYEAVNELMQKLNTKGMPFMLRLAAFQEAFGRLKPVMEEHRGNKVIPASLSFWSPKGREAAKKMEQTIAGVSPLSKK